jgi:hypothetical protein
MDFIAPRLSGRTSSFVQVDRSARYGVLRNPLTEWNVLSGPPRARSGHMVGRDVTVGGSGGTAGAQGGRNRGGGGAPEGRGRGGGDGRRCITP